MENDQDKLISFKSYTRKSKKVVNHQDKTKHNVHGSSQVRDYVHGNSLYNKVPDAKNNMLPSTYSDN